MGRRTVSKDTPKQKARNAQFAHDPYEHRHLMFSLRDRVSRGEQVYAMNQAARRPAPLNEAEVEQRAREHRQEFLRRHSVPTVIT